MAQKGARADEDGLLAALQALYRDADALFQGATCEQSSECCRFGITGREPWVTQAEWRLVEDDVRRQGRKLPAIPDDDTCPFLSPEGRCRVYGARPLGCRTFFCERATGPGPVPRKALGALPRRLDALTDVEKGKDAGARPLRSWLREALRA